MPSDMILAGWSIYPACITYSNCTSNCFFSRASAIRAKRCSYSAKGAKRNYAQQQGMFVKDRNRPPCGPAAQSQELYDEEPSFTVTYDLLDDHFRKT
jgi:hypothetical protein